MERMVVVSSVEEFYELYPNVPIFDYEIGQFGVQVWFRDNSEEQYIPQAQGKRKLYVVVSYDSGSPIYMGERGQCVYNIAAAKQITRLEAQGMVHGIMRANQGRRNWTFERVN